MRKLTLIIYMLLILSLISAAAAEAMENIKLRFHFADGDVPASVNPETIKVLFNPNEYVITKATPWKNHDISGLDSPESEFTSGEPFRLQMELFFDSYEEKKDVREYTEKIASLVASDLHNPPVCLMTWGSVQFKCVLQRINVTYTLFLDDGTPVKAVMDTVWKEFKPVQEHELGNINDTEKVLDIMENRFNEGWPGILDLIPASQNSIPILKAYDADSFQDVVDVMFENFEAETRTYNLVSVNQANCSAVNIIANAETSISDKFCQVRGFKVEIDGAGGKEADTAWEHVEGGELIIELTETTTGADKFQTTSPGHKSVGEITLRGSMTSKRKDIANWIMDTINNKSFNCRRCVDVSLSLFDEHGNAVETFDFSALDYAIFKNELLFLTLDNDSLNALVIKVKRTRANGSEYNGPPKIFIILPTSGPAFMPVGIGGMNFDVGTIPFFNNTPSIALFNFGTRNLPLIGSISVGFTIVPPAAPTGPGNVVVEYLGQRSNPFPFTKN